MGAIGEKVNNVMRRVLTLRTALIVAVSGVVWFLLFAYTPLNVLMPAKLDNSSRRYYVDMALRVDSLANILATNDLYVHNVEALLGDDLHPQLEDDTTSTNFYDLPLDSLMTAGNAEQHFVKQFEASHRFNLSVLSPIAAEGMVFYPPVQGIPLKSNASTGEIPSLSLTLDKAIPVSSAYRGTIIDAYYVTDKGITVVVQHPNNFITQYSGLGDVFVSRGAKVNAGQRLGMSGGQRYPLSFMIWHDGIALDPGEYIDTNTEESTSRGDLPFTPTNKR